MSALCTAINSTMQNEDIGAHYLPGVDNLYWMDYLLRRQTSCFELPRNSFTWVQFLVHYLVNV